MNDDLPDRLKPVRDLLMDSADGPGSDPVPPPPGDLIDELEKKLAPATTSTPAPEKPSALGRILHFLTSPGFAVAAAAVIVLFLAGPLITGGDKPEEGFRDGAPPVADGPKVVLLGVDDETYEQLASGDLFDARALVRVATGEEADAVASPKVVVDLIEGRLRAYDAGGNDFYRHAIKLESSLPTDIARALSKLPK